MDEMIESVEKNDAVMREKNTELLSVAKDVLLSIECGEISLNSMLMVGENSDIDVKNYTNLVGRLAAAIYAIEPAFAEVKNDRKTG